MIAIKDFESQNGIKRVEYVNGRLQGTKSPLGDAHDWASIGAEALMAFTETAHRTKTNSDGRFQIEIPKGEYLLFTDTTFFGEAVNMQWLVEMSASEAEVSLSLNQDYTVQGSLYKGARMPATTLELLDQILLKSGPTQMQDRVMQSNRAEAEALRAIGIRQAPVAKRVEAEPSAEDEKRMKIIFKDWAARRGAALKQAAKMEKREGDTFMQRIDKGLVKSLTEKYKITHEELDRIEAYGAKKNWW